MRTNESEVPAAASMPVIHRAARALGFEEETLEARDATRGVDEQRRCQQSDDTKWSQNRQRQCALERGGNCRFRLRTRFVHHTTAIGPMARLG